MPKIKVLPHAEICPQGAEFEAESGISVCENLLNQDIDLEPVSYTHLRAHETR